VFRILREMVELIGDGLHVSPPGQLDHAHADWPLIGVRPRLDRVALIQADADRELAAYVLARACLRRTGFDPRVVHRVLVVGPADRLERNLRRLWVGATMGPVDDERAFAGPVDEPRAAQFLAAHAAWRAREGITTICPGGRLERADAPGLPFLAPALFRSPTITDDSQLEASLADEPALIGPLLVIQPVAGEAAERRAELLLDRLADPGRGRLRFGVKPRDVVLHRDDRQIHGALLVERLPPGLPEPRP
jgi:hypothetical protein